MKYHNHILDVGAYNGVDGLALAINNPNFLVHAFEANPDLIDLIKENKKKIEKYKKKEICNYIINNCAVSNTEGILDFYITKNPTVSSLNKFSENLDNSWEGYKEEHFKYVKKIKVKVITLEQYCLDNKINNINYLHIDTQGNDLKVLKGLKKKIDILEQGVLEAAVSKEMSLYEGNHTVDDVKRYLIKENFKILKIENIDNNIKNEKNIFFLKENLKLNKNVILKYNLRYYNRIISGRVNFKDRFLDNLRIFFKF